MKEQKTIFLRDQEGITQKFYSLNIKTNKGFVFETEKELQKHLDEEKIHFGGDYNKTINSGLLKDYSEPYEVVNILNTEHNLRGTDENYSSLNPFRKSNT